MRHINRARALGFLGCSITNQAKFSHDIPDCLFRIIKNRPRGFNLRDCATLIRHNEFRLSAANKYAHKIAARVNAVSGNNGAIRGGLYFKAIPQRTRNYLDGVHISFCRGGKSMPCCPNTIFTRWQYHRRAASNLRASANGTAIRNLSYFVTDPLKCRLSFHECQCGPSIKFPKPAEFACDSSGSKSNRSITLS